MPRRWRGRQNPKLRRHHRLRLPAPLLVVRSRELTAPLLGVRSRQLTRHTGGFEPVLDRRRHPRIWLRVRQARPSVSQRLDPRRPQTAVSRRARRSARIQGSSRRLTSISTVCAPTRPLSRVERQFVAVVEHPSPNRSRSSAARSRHLGSFVASVRPSGQPLRVSRFALVHQRPKPKRRSSHVASDILAWNGQMRST